MFHMNYRMYKEILPEEGEEVPKISIDGLKFSKENWLLLGGLSSIGILPDPELEGRLEPIFGKITWHLGEYLIEFRSSKEPALRAYVEHINNPDFVRYSFRFLVDWARVQASITEEAESYRWMWMLSQLQELLLIGLFGGEMLEGEPFPTPPAPYNVEDWAYDHDIPW